MTTNDAYNLAIAFLRFKDAYITLAKETAKHDDFDMSTNYPFYLLDFEQITPAVQQWCNTYSTAILRALPERITNPGCFDCSFKGLGVDASGMCKGYKEKQCNIFPTIIFTRDAVMPFMTQTGYAVDNMSD